MARLRAARTYGGLVEKLRSAGPDVRRSRAVDKVANTFEYVVHHEDLRRAQPDWAPAQLDPADVDALWAPAAQGPVVLRSQAPRRRPSSGAPTPARPPSPRRATDPVTITGDVVEAGARCRLRLGTGAQDARLRGRSTRSRRVRAVGRLTVS